MQTDKIIIPFVKHSDITSFNSLKPFKLLHKKTKIGHTGTLDSFADGLMIGLIGKGTKLSSYFTNCDKTYLACFVFGYETNTLDRLGSVVLKKELPKFDKVFPAIESFIGESFQTPPLYSRVSVDGKRAYKVAQAGKDLKIDAKKIKMYSIDVLDYQKQGDNLKTITLKIRCSKGTYIRAFCRDLAYSLNSCAYVLALRRTELANFKIKDCLWQNKLLDFNLQILNLKENFQNLEPPIKLKNSKTFDLTPLEYDAYAIKFTNQIAKHINLTTLELNPRFKKSFTLGQKIKKTWFKGIELFEEQLEKKPLAVFCETNFLGLINFTKNQFIYSFVF